MLALTPASAHDGDPHAPQKLDKIEVKGSSPVMRPGSLRNELVQTESLDGQSIERSGATNVNEALDKRPGIAVQVECSICNVRNVLLNNLPGRYTTLLIDGVPIYSSVSSAYGLDSVSVYGLERIDVSRGAGTSLIAPEALSGTVNLVTKRPHEDAFNARLQGGSFGSRQADLHLAKAWAGGAFTATVQGNRHDSVDGDGDGISEFTGFNRKMAGFGLFLDDLGGFRVKSRLDFVDEKRGGGALGTDYAAIKASLSGNPFDFTHSRNGSPSKDGWINPEDGELLPYDGGRGGFSEIIFTDRKQFVATAERALGSDSVLRLAVGLAKHEQDSFYEGAFYVAAQTQRYLEASLRTQAGDWTLTGGLSQRYEDLKSQGVTAAGDAVDGIDNYVYRVPAVFLQAYRSFWDDALELNASLRHDRHNVFGGITSPRANLLWHVTPQWSLRASSGKGFRAPTSFFEQDHGILDTLRIQREITKPEVSLNHSLALSFAGDRLQVTASANFNRIKNFAVLDPGAEDPVTNDPITLFTSAERPVTVRGIDLNASWQATPALLLQAGLELSRYRFEPGTLVFARPTRRAFLGFDWDSDGWELTARLTHTGAMNLLPFHDDGSGSQGRFNFDGTPKKDRSPAFTTVDLRVEKQLDKRWAFYVGADNLTDYRQVDKESPLFVDGEGAPDVVHLWGPNRGRYVYAGLKLAF
ncbi:MAG: TonB-dependent receptor [Burkholderiales bacterium]|nr:TonB-dependent receptor [Burkholderiales bacterium]